MSLVGEFVEGGLVGAGCGAQPRRPGWTGIGHLGEAGAEQVIVGVSEQQGVV